MERSILFDNPSFYMYEIHMYISVFQGTNLDDPFLLLSDCGWPARIGPSYSSLLNGTNFCYSWNINTTVEHKHCFNTKTCRNDFKFKHKACYIIVTSWLKQFFKVIRLCFEGLIFLYWWVSKKKCNSIVYAMVPPELHTFRSLLPYVTMTLGFIVFYTRSVWDVDHELISADLGLVFAGQGYRAGFFSSYLMGTFSWTKISVGLAPVWMI